MPTALPASSLRLGWALVPLLVAALYLPGLAGGFVLDDHANLAPIEGYLRGELRWQAVVLGNESGVLGRPLGMASLLLNAAAGGMDPFGFKLANLVLHLLCAALVALLTRTVLLALDGTRASATPVALATAAFWALLPIHVSTVLYVVQRMAMLSALFTLLALWLYGLARRRMIDGRAGGAALLWAAVPGAMLAALMCKENGALAPALCAVLEAACFRGRTGATRGPGLRAWYACFLGLPMALGAVALALHPQWFLGGYAFRPFTLHERVLSELRALWDYAAAIALPTGDRLGLVHDDYPRSLGWLAPPTTALAGACWLLALSLAVVLARRGRPLVLTGLAFFLVAHALESTVLPLELYFEHRNYLPSLGVLWVLLGLGLELRRAVGADPLRFGHPVTVCLAVALVAYTLGTREQVLNWTSNEALYRQAVATHPGSERAHAELGALLSGQGRRDEAVLELRAAAEVNPANASAYALAAMLADCSADRPTDPAVDARVRALASDSVTLPAAAVFAQLAERVERGQCPKLDARRVIDIGNEWLARARAPGSNWQIHYRVARLQSARGDFAAALPHAMAAWNDSGHELRVGVLAFQLYATLGDMAGCRRQLAELRAADDGRDLLVRDALQKFQAFVDGGARSS